MADTKEISLSGIPTLVTYMGGEQQGILTRKQKQGDLPQHVALAMSVLVSVGDYVFAEHAEKANEAFMQQLLACHVKQIIAESRMFTYDDEPFIFTIDFKRQILDEEGKVQMVSDSKEMEVPLGEGLAVVPVKYFDPEAIAKCKTLNDIRKLVVKPLEATDYQEVVKNALMEFDLPHAKTRVCMQMRDMSSAKVVKDENSLDSNIALLTAFPKRWNPESGTWILYTERDLKKMHAKDLEYMRAVLMKHDGKVDSELEYEDPANPGTNRYTDMLNEPTFFFPSGVA